MFMPSITVVDRHMMVLPHITPMFTCCPFALNPYEKDLRITTAHAFAAFKKAIQNLKTYYESELPAHTMNLEFPYKCDYKNRDAIIHFEYVSCHYHSL